MEVEKGSLIYFIFFQVEMLKRLKEFIFKRVK